MQLLLLWSVEIDVKEDIVTVSCPLRQGDNIPLLDFIRTVYSVMQYDIYRAEDT